LLECLRKELPPWITELLKVPGVGPRRVRRLHERLGIRSMEDLHHAAKHGRVRQLRGFGELIERRIAEATVARRPVAARR
jgi:DNA polymerase (family 10)